MRALTNEDKNKLLVGAAFVIGAVVRFAPGISAGFPLNDGGMFYRMILDLGKSNYALPRTTSYNFLDIPYAYPPLGFYLVRFLSDVLPTSELTLLRWIPPTVSLISILAFYLLAAELLDSPLRAGISAMFYALTPGSFSWFIMGGGLTRGLGSLFLLLSVWSVYRLFRRNQKRFIGFATIFCALTILSHPEAGLHTAAICGALWLFYGRTRQKSLYTAIILFGTLLLSSPWWLTVIRNHGLAPFISALHSGLYGTSVIKAIASNVLARQSFIPVLLILRLAGIAWAVWKRQFFLLAWLVFPFMVEPRSAPSVVFYPLCMLAALGLVDAFPALFRQFHARTNGSREMEDTVGKSKVRWTELILFLILFYLFVESYLYGFRQINTSLTSTDRATMDWISQNTPTECNFLIITGNPAPETDAFQEWFPALAARQSITTIQGLEWVLGPDFVKRHTEVRELQACENLECINMWSKRNNLDFEYILLRSASKHNLSQALEKDNKSELVYQTDEVWIYEVR